jgi:cystinosin
LAQLFLDAFIANDFTGIFGNPAKFGLSLLAMSFDVLFMIQHYILYQEPDEASENEREPIFQRVDDP